MCAAVRETLLAEIDRITSLDDDRIFRRVLNLIEASLRTNVYQRVDGQTRSTIAFKLQCSAVENLPLPRPLYEIFVSSPDVEGLHCASVRSARGGLRWSDRPMDFRTEILGLVKAQQVKNHGHRAGGREGGFVPKLLPPASDRDAWFAEGTRAYRIFINALLDSPTRSATARSSRPPTRCAMMAMIPISSWPPTRAPRPSPIPRTAFPRRAAIGWAMPSPPAAPRATTQEDGHQLPAASGRP